MSTTAQIEANQANSQLSTGPITPEGKARSATNATKLGFYAKQAVLLTEQDHQAFEALTVAFRFEVHPVGPVERALFTQVERALFTQIVERATSCLSSNGKDNNLVPVASRCVAKRW